MKMVSLTKIFLFHCDLPFKSVSQSFFLKNTLILDLLEFQLHVKLESQQKILNGI